MNAACVTALDKTLECPDEKVISIGYLLRTTKTMTLNSIMAADHLVLHCRHLGVRYLALVLRFLVGVWSRPLCRWDQQKAEVAEPSCA